MKFKKVLIIALSLLALSSIACGRKDYPSPSVVDDTFTWNNPSAIAQGECISFSAHVGGNAQNLAVIVLEVQNLDDSCRGCPFVANMSERIYATEVLDMASSTVSINYCPTRITDEYRWRFVGINKIRGVAHVNSQVMVLDTRTNMQERISITDID